MYPGPTVSASFEDILDELDLVDFTRPRGWYQKDINFEYCTKTSNTIWDQSTRGGTIRRTSGLPLCFVLGPNGSGKTFFARKQVATRLYKDEWPQKKNVTLYLSLKTANVTFINKDVKKGTETLKKKAATELFDWIMEQLDQETDIQWMSKLNMHVCIIIDDVEDHHVKMWFKNEDMVKSLCKEAEKFAESVVVTVCSTGLTVHEGESATGAYTFRMTPWGESDLECILNSFSSKLNLVSGVEDEKTLANALWAHPKLGALATNAYMAYSMVETFVDVRSTHYRESLSSQLDDFAAYVIPKVFFRYMHTYKIDRELSQDQQRIAASVFQVLEESKNGLDEVPKLEELTGQEIAIAESFLHCYKIEGSDNFTITVTPAQEIVLFAMAGMSISLMARWKTEELHAAFYVVRQSMLRCMPSYDRDFKSLSLYRLQKQTDNAYDMIFHFVPIAEVAPVEMGHEAPFADIIGPYTLIQVWRTSNPLPLQVDLHKELQKCGLLKDDSKTMVLEGLLALWRLRTNTLDRLINQVSGGRPNNPVKYTMTEGESGVEIMVNERPNAFMPIFSEDIDFVLSTDAWALKLRFDPFGPSVTITKANLDVDMEVDVSTLSDPEQSAWRRFMHERVWNEVRIKFLFPVSC